MLCFESHNFKRCLTWLSKVAEILKNYCPWCGKTTIFVERYKANAVEFLVRSWVRWTYSLLCIAYLLSVSCAFKVTITVTIIRNIGCPIIIWTGLNTKIGIVQKVYEGWSCSFAKMIPWLDNHFGKRSVSSLIYFLNNAYFDI